MNVLFSDVTFSYLHPGGKQVHAAQLMSQFLRKGISVTYENWHDPTLRPDVVHFFGYNDVDKLRALKQRGVKLVYTHIMDGLTNQSLLRRRYHGVKSRLLSHLPRRADALLNWRGLQLFDALVYMHRADRDAAIAIYGVDPARTRVIPHGVEDVAAFQLPADTKQPKYLVSLGSIVPRKNCVFTASVCGAAQIPVTFVGHAPEPAGEYHQRFDAAADAAGATVRSDVCHEEKLRLLANASGFILLSHGESGCISVYEAAATGLPLLLADLPWAHGYEEPHWLEHCPARDHAPAVRKVRDFFGRCARQQHPTVRVRTWSEIAELYLNTYRCAIEGRPVDALGPNQERGF